MVILRMAVKPNELMKIIDVEPFKCVCGSTRAQQFGNKF